MRGRGGLTHTCPTSMSAEFEQLLGRWQPLPDGAGDGVAARPHLIVNLDWRQLPADPVIGAAHGEPRLGEGALVSSHAWGGLFMVEQLCGHKFSQKVERTEITHTH